MATAKTTASATGLTLSEKLMKIQSELKAPKNLYNSFGKYHYRNVESIQEALKPLQVKYGVFTTLSDEIVEVGGRVYVKATADITDIVTKEFIEVSAYAREAEDKKGMDDAQVTGSTSSYARKYALNGLFLLDDTKDVDTEEYQSQANAPAKAQKAPTKAQAPSGSKTTPELICTRCNQPIAPHGDASPRQVANFTMKELGKMLCYDCGKAIKQARTAPIEAFVTDNDAGLPFPIED
jgi:hypothetical protein